MELHKYANFKAFALFLSLVFLSLFAQAQSQQNNSSQDLSIPEDQTPLIHRSSGKVVTAGDAVDKTTEAGYKGTPGKTSSGYYYTGSNNPAGSIPTKPSVPLGTSGSSSGGFSPGANLTGILNLVGQSFGIFQPLGNLMKPPQPEICEDCETADADRSSELGGPAFDPNLSNPVNDLIAQTRDAHSESISTYFGLGMFPFERENGQVNSMLFGILETTLLQPPLSSVLEEGAEGFKDFCPTFQGLTPMQKKAVASLIFSEVMRGPDKSYQTNMQQGSRKGLCLSDYESVKPLLSQYENNMGISLNSAQDLYKPETAIPVCVFEVYESIKIAKESGESQKFFPNHSPEKINAVKEKISRLSICQGVST